MKGEETKSTWRAGAKAVARHLQPYKGALGTLSVLGLVSAMANGVVPYVSGRFFDGLIQLSIGNVEQAAGLPLWALLLLAWAAIQIVANSTDWFAERLSSRVTTELQLGIQARSFGHLFRLPLSFHKEERINQVMEQLSKASWRVPSILRTLSNFAPQFLSIIVGIILAASINVLLASVLLVGVLLYLVLLSFVVRPMAEVDRQAHEIWNEAYGDAATAVGQIESVKQAVAEEYETDKVQHNLLERARGWWMRMEYTWSNVGFFQRMLVLGTQATVFVLSVGMIAQGTITVGELVALNGYAAMFFGPFVTLGYQWQTLQNGLTAALQAEPTFLRQQEVYSPQQVKQLESIRGSVEFAHVSFRYAPDQPETLSDVSFTVEPGQSVAFVGESGVGKSTAVSLISAYYFPDKGRVLVDGVDTRELGLADLRQHIAVVPQEVALFNDTIANNIRYGSFGATEARMRTAAREAHIAEFVEGLPQAYGTLVGERGMKLSVGQKQRVSIARAILRDPSILILDEPTSALDARTEQLITESLEKLMEGRTTFIIAHRLSTVRKADKILVFEKGKIVEQGTHNELIKQGCVYQRLYEYQIGLH